MILKQCNYTKRKNLLVYKYIWFKKNTYFFKVNMCGRQVHCKSEQLSETKEKSPWIIFYF